MDDVVEASRVSSLLPIQVAYAARQALREDSLFEEIIRDTKDELNYRGVALWRGIPVSRWRPEEAKAILWLLGDIFGDPVTQRVGEFVIDITHQPGGDAFAKKRSNPNSTGNVGFHCDASDILGLMCFQNAEIGGHTLLVSANSIHSTIAKERPECLQRLYTGFRYGKRGEQADGRPKVSKMIPVFSWTNSRLACRFIRIFIEDGASIAGEPLSIEDVQLLDYFEEVASRSDLCFQLPLERGDVLFVNNYTVLHGRTKYCEQPNNGVKRHLLKIWIKAQETLALDDVDEAMRFSIRHHQGLGLSYGEVYV